jgi:hypothetical protein
MSRVKFLSDTNERLALIETKVTPERKDLVLRYMKWRAEYRQIFVDVGFSLDTVTETPNRYCGDSCCPHLPAVTIETGIGTIEFWWRKRVTVIDWTKTVCHKTADELFPDAKDTKDGRSIHCWSYDSVRERLRAIRDDAVKFNPFAAMRVLDGDHMIKCSGCGNHVEREHVVEMARFEARTCVRCARCEETPALRESYRRGFNAGVEAMIERTREMADNGRRLQKRDRE